MQPLCGRSEVSSHEDQEDFGQGEKQGDPEQPLPDLFHRTQLTLPEERLAAFEVGLHPYEFIVTHQSHFTFEGRKVNRKGSGALWVERWFGIGSWLFSHLVMPRRQAR